MARLCDEHEIDAIVHFAAETHVDRSIHCPLVFVETNVLGTASLLEAVRERPHIHFHHVSTDEVYGSLGDEGAFREDSPYHPNSPYAASKAASDHLVRAYAHTYGIQVTISNCSNNYGPHQHAEKLIPVMIGRLRAHEPLPIYGDGSNVRDWLYVDDHADAVWQILTRGRPGETYAVGGEGERTNLALVSALVNEVAVQTGAARDELAALIAFVEDRPGHDHRYAIDATKLREELGWRPTHDLAEGLALTVRWYLDHPQWLDPAP
jgi:dTDP-glucose 4,6-dehydratase